ncbi:MAG: hypothetical protein K6F05_08250 [Succinivibrio sp.]|nr:hypothetical protein [Succinivibrio sp.]
MRFLHLAIKAFTFLFAPVLWLGYHYDQLSWVLPGLMLLFILAQWLQVKLKRQQPGLSGGLMALLFGLGALLCALSAAFKSLNLIMYYPVAVNLVFLLTFAISLRGGSSLVEGIARRAGTEITPEIRSYTRKVTQAWCCFFIVNGSIALFTALKGDLDLWTLWNGCLSYICIGLMAAGEYLIRRKLQRGAQ